MDIFSYIYAIFVGWYGTDLDEFLMSSDAGLNYIIIFGITFLILLIIGLLYYKVIDKPKWAYWYCWLIALGINAASNFLWPWQALLQNLDDGDMAVLDQATGKMVNYVTENNCLMFGVANIVVATFFFFVMSFIIRLWSTNCRYSPFSLSHKR